LTSDQLNGRWVLSSVQPAGQTAQIAPAGVSYDLTFADGRASVHADCNLCSGALTVSGQTLTIGPALACTRAACPTMAFESLYESILGGASDAAISGSVLTLSSTRGVLRFTR
jgi:heat shock protein HslJ